MKKLIAIMLAVLLLAGCSSNASESTGASSTPVETASKPTWETVAADRTLKAQQYFVYDCETEQFITISGSPADKIYPASVTKLFTAYVAIEFLGADHSVTAGDALDLVAAGSSVAEIEKSNVLTVRQLVEGMLLPSGNDAAYILAVEAGRTLKKNSSLSAIEAAAAFVMEMNAQAKLLGLNNTYFANPDGIHSEEHYTTFADLAKLGMLALEDPTIREVAMVSRENVTFQSGQTKTWTNTNALINPESPYYCPYAIGLKTGQTPYAGSCLLSAFEYEGTTLLIGVFGCPEPEDRFPDTLQLLQTAIS